MKKVFVLFLAAVLLAGLLAVPASATYADGKSTDYIQGGTNAHDLTAYGSHIYLSYKVDTPPAMDGVIGTGEYPAPSDVSTLEDGLTLSNTSGTTGRMDRLADFEDGKFTLTTYLAYDDTYAYIAEVVDTLKPISVVQKNGRPNTLITHLNYGLNQSELLPNHYSYLSNYYTYTQTSTTDYDDPATFVVNRCSQATRLIRDLNAKDVSLTVTDAKSNKNRYTDTDGVEWGLSEYGKAENTAYGGSVNDGNYQYVFEYRIPLNDAIRSQNEYSDASELLAKDLFYGSLYFQVAITRMVDGENEQIYLTNGMSKDDTFDSLDGSSAPVATNVAIGGYWPESGEGSNTMNYVPSQVWHVGAYDPADPFVPSTSGFRPEPSGVGLNAEYTGVRAGKDFTFTPVGDGLDITQPAYGYQRSIPTSWQIRFNNTVAASGAIADNAEHDFTVTVNTKNFYTGLHTLIVTYKLQTFDGTNWVDAGSKQTIARSFTVTGGVRAATGASAQTGDSLTWLWITLGVVALSVVAVAVFFFSRRRRSI